MVAGRFTHEAMLYDDEDAFVGTLAAFLRPAVAAGEPALIVVDEAKHHELRRVLGPEATNVTYIDVREAGRNPSHLIPLWQSFLDEHAGTTGLWGVAEPQWLGRSSSETAECHRHEALLNLALAEEGRFTLLCPLDASQLEDEAVAGSVRWHPHIRDAEAGAVRANPAYAAVDPSALLAEPLAAAPEGVDEFPFTAADLRDLRARVASAATGVGFPRERADDLVLAVDEIATNSHRYGGGGGVLRTWVHDGGLVCEIRDRGQFTDPLVGQRHPSSRQIGGRGLWIANQLCDLVQVRSTGDGAVVRLHARPTP